MGIGIVTHDIWPRVGGLERQDLRVRRRLRCVLWRQWKRPRTRAREMHARGLDAARAWRAAYNGRGPRNARASHMNTAVPTRWLTDQGLTSLVQEHRRLAS